MVVFVDKAISSSGKEACLTVRLTIDLLTLMEVDSFIEAHYLSLC